MKILRNVVLVAFPILIIINLYQFIFADTIGIDYQFKGFAYLHQQLSTFPGIEGTLTVITDIRATATMFISLYNSDNIIDKLGAFFTLFGYVFYIPISLTIDIFKNIYWFITLLNPFSS